MTHSKVYVCYSIQAIEFKGEINDNPNQKTVFQK